LGVGGTICQIVPLSRSAFPGLVPPAVERAQIQCAVRRGFHPACATRFERTSRRAQPDVRALSHRTRDGHVVAFQEDQAAAEFGAAAERDDLLDQFFAGVIARVSLSGEDNLHGTARIVQNPRQAFGIAQQQVRAFVRRKSPSEPNGQSVGIEHFIGGFDL
jgi:hypothetical protein